MFQPGDVITYLDMCQAEGVNLQKGMNFRMRNGFTIILMSLRKNAPYADQVENEGRVLIYEGHDAPKGGTHPDPKIVDQPLKTEKGSLNENGKFFKAVEDYRVTGKYELVKVYEKIKAGIWVYNGVFSLIDAWQEKSNNRYVFKFKLELVDERLKGGRNIDVIEHDRIIPSSVKVAVWKRDKGQCVICERADNLHFDHIIPYSKGGSSLLEENIQLLCVGCNLRKSDAIE